MYRRESLNTHSPNRTSVWHQSRLAALVLFVAFDCTELPALAASQPDPATVISELIAPAKLATLGILG
jgi:hypothetical protein